MITQEAEKAAIPVREERSRQRRLTQEIREEWEFVAAYGICAHCGKPAKEKRSWFTEITWRICAPCGLRWTYYGMTDEYAREELNR